MARKTVLVIDQEKLLGELLQLAIQSDECWVRVVTSIKEGNAEIRTYTPDLLLVNPSIPGGLKLLESSDPPTTKKIALTDSQLMRGMARKIDVEIIDKKGSLSDLIHKLRTHLALDSLPSQKGENVLVVDDDSDVRKTLAAFLESSGYAVCTAGTGEEALTTLDRDSSISVILLDVNMPGMGGMSVLKEVMKRTKPPAAIMLSGVSDQEIARYAMNLGAFDYILKPPDSQRVEAAISASLSHVRYQGGSFWQRLMGK